MIRIVPLRILVLIAIFVRLIDIPQFASAQHGGHGGGGFHAGGGGFHGGGSRGNFGGFHGGGFHGGGGFGGFHGGGYGFYGRRYGGFYGRGFGFPSYGFGFGFGPYWGYPYYYGYGPWLSPYAYYYPYDSYYYPDDPRDNRYPRDNRDGCDYRHEDDHPCKSNNENAPAKPSSTDVPESSPQRNYVTTKSADNGPTLSLADYKSAASTDPAAVPSRVTSDSPPRNSAKRPLPSGLRPAVRNVIQALRAMPPDARERQLNSGRYHLSPEEMEFVTTATQPSPALMTR
jgi:hypothetical protein